MKIKKNSLLCTIVVLVLIGSFRSDAQSTELKYASNWFGDSLHVNVYFNGEEVDSYAIPRADSTSFRFNNETYYTDIKKHAEFNENKNLREFVQLIKARLDSNSVAIPQKGNPTLCNFYLFIDSEGEVQEVLRQTNGEPYFSLEFEQAIFEAILYCLNDHKWKPGRKGCRKVSSILGVSVIW